MKYILVTGSSGQLALEIKKNVTDSRLQNTEYSWIFADKETLNICDRQAVSSFFKNNSIDICINCAAYTGVDKAEEDKKNCKKINIIAVGYLAEICKKNQTVLFHISSDYVFDGTKGKPYVESDITNPINYYGETKVAGEKIAIENNPKTIIIRTSWLYSKEFGKNFYKTMLGLAKQKDEINVVSDQTGTPTDASNLAKFIIKLIIACTNEKFNEWGIIHFAGDTICSWADFAQSIVQEHGLDCKINYISSQQYQTKAKRPSYSALRSIRNLY